MERVSPLKKYLLRHDMTITALAELVPCSRSGLSRVVNGVVRCGADLAYRIEPATNYEVSAQEMIDWGREVFARPRGSRVA